MERKVPPPGMTQLNFALGDTEGTFGKSDYPSTKTLESFPMLLLGKAGRRYPTFILMASPHPAFHPLNLGGCQGVSFCQDWNNVDPLIKSFHAFDIQRPQPAKRCSEGTECKSRTGPSHTHTKLGCSRQPCSGQETERPWEDAEKLNAWQSFFICTGIVFY